MKQIDLSNVSAQEVFDRVVTHLRAQNARSFILKMDSPFDNEYTCAYRGANGFKCAIGCLIPDEEYKPEMERGSLEMLLMDTANCPRLFAKNSATEKMFNQHYYLLSSLQDIHDRIDISKWEKHFEMCAKRFYVNFTPKKYNE